MPYSNNRATLPLNTRGSGGDMQLIAGLNNGSIGNIIKEGLYNEKSLYKPCKYRSWGKLTTEQRRLANYGWTFQPGSMYYQAVDNVEGRWKHVRPTGGEAEPYRITDFDGYIGGTSYPWSSELYGTAYPDVDVSIEIQGMPSDFFKWAYMMNRTWYLAIVAVKVTGTRTEYIVYPMTSSRSPYTTDNYLFDGQRCSIRLTSGTFFSAGAQITFYPVLATYDWGDSYFQWQTDYSQGGEVLAIPGTELTFTVENPPVPSFSLEFLPDKSTVNYRDNISWFGPITLYFVANITNAPYIEQSGSGSTGIQLYIQNFLNTPYGEWEATAKYVPGGYIYPGQQVSVISPSAEYQPATEALQFRLYGQYNYNGRSYTYDQYYSWNPNK